MRTIITILFILGIPAYAILAQNTPIDKLFDKYADQEGFTSVFISKEMFELFVKNGSGKDSEEFEKAISGLKSIKILTIEDPEVNKKVNFSKELGNQIPLDEYITIMTVREKNQDLRMMVKEKDGKIMEFLMLGGGEDNVLISIVGEINMNSISKLSHGTNIKGLQELEHLEKNQEPPSGKPLNR